MWVRKYRPESLSDYRGASKQKKKLKEWAEEWEPGDKPVLLHGQAGTGKTSMVEALANDLDYELVETNASDVRTKSKLKSELKEATRQESFFGGQKLILVDEVDGMSSTDRGGTSELAEIVDETRFPLVMTANDAYDSKIKTLRNRAEMIEIGSVHTNSIVAHLKEILENEGIEYEESAVKRIARQADGQMRSAINDLQAAAAGREKLTDKDTEAVGVRDSEQEVFDSLKMIFKTSSAETARRSTDNLSEDPDTFVQWVRENIPREYKKVGDRKRALDWLSKADVFNGRIRRSMNWKLLKYVYHFSTIGVALSKDEKYDGWTRYQYPSKLKQMGRSRSNRNKRDEVSQKIGEKLHISLSTSVETMPFLAKIIENDKDVAEQMELTDEDVEFIDKFVS